MGFKLDPPMTQVQKKGSKDMSSPKAENPHNEWWDLISGYEDAFSSLETLYHALSDSNARIESIYVHSNGSVRLQVKWMCGSTGTVPRQLKFAQFDISADLKDHNKQSQARYVLDVVEMTSKRNRPMGRILTAVWMTHIKAEKKLKELTTV